MDFALLSRLLAFSYPRPAPRSQLTRAARLADHPDRRQRRWPQIHQTHGFPAVWVVQLRTTAAQTRLYSIQWLPVPLVRAVALCDTPCLLDRTKPVYSRAPA